MAKKLISLSTSLGYYPAELKKSKSGWRIVYHVDNPTEIGKMVRKTVKINRIKCIVERRKFAQNLKREINRKLENGWNPYLNESAPNGFVKLETALTTFLNHKKRELRPDSVRTYKSYISMILHYIEKENLNRFAVSFSVAHAIAYMNFIYLTKQVSNTTYNNYLLGYRVLFNWLLQNKYVAKNPFNAIKKKKNEAKTRRILTRVELQNLFDLYQNDTKYLTIIYLAFYGLLRPNEITHLKPENCNLKESFLVLTHTKNRKNRVVALPKFLRNKIDTTLKKTKPDQYLFGKGFIPGSIKLDPRQIAKEWVYARKRLIWGKDLQFYSLRDSGIVSMLKNNIPLEEVQKHADHSSITITEKYITLAFPKGVTSVKRLTVKGAK
jgi:integrase